MNRKHASRKFFDKIYLVISMKVLVFFGVIENKFGVKKLEPMQINKIC